MILDWRDMDIRGMDWRERSELYDSVTGAQSLRVDIIEDLHRGITLV